MEHHAAVLALGAATKVNVIWIVDVWSRRDKLDSPEPNHFEHSLDSRPVRAKPVRAIVGQFIPGIKRKRRAIELVQSTWVSKISCVPTTLATRSKARSGWRM